MKIIGIALSNFFTQIFSTSKPAEPTICNLPAKPYCYDEKIFWQELYQDFFGMTIDASTLEIPYFEFPGGYDLIIVFPLSVVDLFRDLSKKIGLHDFHTYTLLYPKGKPELAQWEGEDIIPIRSTKNGPYAVWVPKLHNHENVQKITAANITLQEYLLQIALNWKLHQSIPSVRHTVLCAGTKGGYGLPGVTLDPTRFNATLTVSGRRVYVMGEREISLRGSFPAKEVPFVI